MAAPLKSASDILTAARKAFSGVQREVDNIRLKIVERRLDRHNVETAPISEKEVGDRVDFILHSAESSALADCWSSSFLSMPLEPGSSFHVDDRFGNLFKRSPLGALSLFGFREGIRAAMIEEARAGMPVEAKPYAPAERMAEIAKVDMEIEALEILEEKIIREAETSGVKIPRREDANPAIFLRRDEDL